MSLSLIKKVLIIILSLISVFFVVKFIIGFYSTKDWNKVNTQIITCPKNNLIKIEDIEGSTFIFEDTLENSNLKTNEITFKEVELGIKSLATVEKSNPKINYLSKNEKLSFEELTNLQECYKDYKITISNSYNFDKAIENKFCSFVLQNDRNYEISECN